MKSFKSLISLIMSFCMLMVVLFSTDAVTYYASADSVDMSINEVCSGNSGANGNLTDATDVDGKYCDWIELYNNGTSSVDLSNWGITDKSSNPFKTTIPQGTTIGAGEYLIIYCCKTYTYIGSDSDTNVYVAINISGDGETLTLSMPTGTDASTGAVTGTTIDEVAVPELAKDVTYGCYPDGNKDARVLLNPTPNAQNSSQSALFSSPSFSKETGVYSSTATISVELTSAAENTEIYYTTDCSDPSDTGVSGCWDDTSTQSYGYVFEMENTDATTAQTAVKTKISSYANNEDMSLYKAIDYNNHTYVAFRALNMKFEDAITFANTVQTYMQSSNESAKVYLATVSDSAENDAVYGVSGMGFYLGASYDSATNTYKWANGEEFTYSNFNEEEGTDATELYITYGTVVKRTKYTGAISVRNRTGASNVLATGVDSTLDKGTVLKAVAKNANGEYSEVETKTYFVGTTFANSAYNGSAIVSLSTDYNSLYSDTVGIHTNPTYKGKEWERVGHLDYIGDDGEFKLGAECGVRISGAASRGNDKKSFRLYARNDYGDKYFNYDFFKDSEKLDGSNVDKYKSLTLRSGANASLTACYADNYLQKMLSVIGGFETQEGNVCMAFLDGEYWGVYILQENYDATYFDERYEVDSDNVLLVKNGMDKTIDPDTGKTTRIDFGFKVEEGEDEDISYYDEMFNFFKNNAGKFKDDALYEQACQMIDIDSFVNYMVAEMSIGNVDWPNNNASMWRTINNETADADNIYNDGKWRFNMFDTEFSTEEYNGGNKNDVSYNYYGTNYINGGLYTRTNIATSSTYSTGGGYDLFYMLTQLCDNSKFAAKFTQKYQDVCNIILDYDHATAKLKTYGDKWDTIINNYQKKRWSASGTGTRIGWMKSFWQYRKGFTASHLSAASKLNLSGETQTVKVAINDVNAGKVYLNGLKLHLDDYTNNTFNANYLVDYDITLTVKPLDGYKFVGWSGTAFSDKTTITLPLGAAVDVKAVFVKNTETGGELLDTPSTEGIFKAPQEPTTVSYSDQDITLADGEQRAATIFNADGTYKQAYVYSETGIYTTALAALTAAKNAMLEGETLRMDCDVEVTGISNGSSFWTVSADNMTFDVNGHTLSCAISGVKAFSLNENMNISIINSAKTGNVTEDDINNISFVGSSSGLFVFAGASAYNKTNTINLVGVKIKCTSSTSRLFVCASYKYNQIVNAYRCYFEGAQYSIYYNPNLYSGLGATFVNCIDKSTNSFYAPTASNNNKLKIRLYNSEVGAFSGASGNSHLYNVVAANTTISKVSVTDYNSSVFMLYGTSSIQSCSPTMVTTAGKYGLYTDVTRDTKITNHTYLAKTGSVYSFENEPEQAIYGDANGDGVVDLKDVLSLKQYCAKWKLYVNKTNADFNQDGSINVIDVLKLSQNLANS